jgi:predicted dehydrogenase
MTTATAAAASVAGQQTSKPVPRPRLAFLGVGWIGRHRMEAIARSGVAEIVGIADPSPEARTAAAGIAPGAALASDLEALLAHDLDGLVIATPSAQHAEQSIAALEHGVAVFCQKPLGRTAAETRRVVDAARSADRLLAVDLSYRQTAAMRRIRELVQEGAIGRVYAAELVFHNAYGPDKSWFYDRALAGGGCVMDLGVHLVDLALWTLGFPDVDAVEARLFARGEPLHGDAVEDHALVRIDLSGGVAVQIACSWNLSAGRDAVIGATFHGTEGGAALHNVDGSFYDFVAERYTGTACERLVSPPDEWGGRAAAGWAARLARDGRFDPEAERLVRVAEVLDLVYRPRD